jgi:hypothetical protein
METTIKYRFWTAPNTLEENLFWTMISKDEGVEVWEWAPYVGGVSELTPQHWGKEDSVYFYAYGYTEGS